MNVREIRRAFDKERRIPRRLVEEWARVTAMAQQSWAEARRRDDYAAFAPWLDRIFALARERADAVGYEGARYDALLDDYEPGMTTERVAALFAELQTELVPLVATLRGAPPVPRDVLARDFPVDRQKLFVEAAANALGFDLHGGRLDVAQHPFCTAIGPGDVRITLRYDPHDVSQGFFSLMHELGHALYDQGLDAAHYGTPMGDAASLGLHESQSRMWENHVGRSEGFWQHFYPRLRSTFPESLNDVALETFRREVNHVAPGPIRVNADEVTYDLHITIRFELELALLSGDLRAADAAGCVERAVRAAPRRASGERSRGMSAGHPLGGRADRLLPDVHARQRVRGAAVRGGGACGRAARGVVRARGVRAAARVAARARAPARDAVAGA